jgi:hypothetical protein
MRYIGYYLYEVEPLVKPRLTFLCCIFGTNPQIGLLVVFFFGYLQFTDEHADGLIYFATITLLFESTTG